METLWFQFTAVQAEVNFWLLDDFDDYSLAFCYW